MSREHRTESIGNREVVEQLNKRISERCESLPFTGCGRENQFPSAVAERDVKTVEDGSSTEEIKGDTQFEGKSDRGQEFEVADSDRQSSQVNWNQSAVAYGDHHFLPLGEVISKNLSIRTSNNREGRTRIHVRKQRPPGLWKVDLKWDDRHEVSAVPDVRKAYRAHAKSSGRGMVKQVRSAFGCLERACLATSRGSVPTKSSPSTMTAYCPGYLSISRDNALWIRLASVNRLAFLAFNFAMEGSVTCEII